MHALNNAVGEKWQLPEDMARALKWYLQEAEHEGLLESASDHWAPGGWYSSEVLAYACRSTTMNHEGRVKYTLGMTPLANNKHQIHHCIGAVVNKTNTHWLALRSIDGVLWKIDSLKPKPVQMTQAQYEAYVDEYQDAYPILLASAHVPENVT